MKKIAKKLVISFAVLALVVAAGSLYGINNLNSTTAHAQTSIVQGAVKSAADKAEVNDANAKSENAAKEKETADGNSEHQDPAGVNVDHQFEGTE